MSRVRCMWSGHTWKVEVLRVGFTVIWRCQRCPKRQYQTVL